ncbi:MAG: hypothetical protein GX134_02130 [candidate division WS1 bacterium]|nr:hypothetical protein [candidate division WS1 bacterium]
MSSPLHASYQQERAGSRAMGPILWVVAALSLRACMPYLPVPAHPVTDLAGGMLYMLVVLLMAIELGARLGADKRLVVYSLLAAAALFAASTAASELFAAEYMSKLAAGEIAGSPEGRLPASLWIIGSVKDMALIVFAVLGGALLSRIAREAKLLLPIAVTVAVVDAVGVLYQGGPTAQMLERNPQLVQTFAASIPAIGAASTAASTGGVHPGLALGFIGIGDFLFLGFFFAALVRFGLNLEASRLGAIAASLTAMALVLVAGAHLPGLPFIAAGCVVPNLKSFRYTRQEALALAVGGLFIILFCAVIVLFGQATRTASGEGP